MHKTLLSLSVTALLSALSTLGASAQVAGRTYPPHLVSHPVAPKAAAARLARGGHLAGGATSMAPAIPQSPSKRRAIPPQPPVLLLPPPPPDNLHTSAQQVLINQDRAANGGLGALAWSPCLQQVALANAQRIAAQGYLSHTDGPTQDLKCGLGNSAGENIAYISSGIDDVMANTMFMNSPPHRANILGANYHYVATAWVIASNGYAYIAVEFS